MVKDTCHQRRWNPDKKVWAVGLADLKNLLIPELRLNNIDYTFSESYLNTFEQKEYKPKITSFNTKLPLYPYQIIGANKLIENRYFCLFDSIGLGKTAQILAAIQHLELKNVLIVVPNSIRHQWVAEMEKFTDLTATIIEGTPKKRAQLWQEEGIKIINYEKLICQQDYQQAVNKVFDCVVLDEATRIKNTRTKISTAIGNLNTLRKWAVSGSPVENSIQDLFSIYKFVNPDVFGNWYSFKENFLITEIQIFNSHEVEIVVGYKNLDLLKETIKPSSIRRVKSEVLKDLPDVVEETIWIDLNPKEERWYRALGQIIGEKVSAIRKHIDRASFLGELQLMRLLCNGEVCLKQSKTMNPKVLEWLPEVGDTSTKIDRAESLLLDLTKENNSKIIVFSDFLLPLKELKRRLNNEAIKTAELHGEISNKKEQITLFKTSPDVNVLLAQTKTGGYGLNLQEANTVVFLNRHYNPAVEEQAIGRVYRAGQNKKVMIFYILVSDSREEKINEILNDKREITDLVIKEDKPNNKFINI